MRKAFDLTGHRYGKLVVKSLSDRPSYVKNKNRYWLCVCDCGIEKSIRSEHLRDGRINSCGCWISSHVGKDTYQSKEYRSWQNMKNRCLNKKVRSYKGYGDRGITIDNRFNKFEDFLRHMGNSPSDDHSIDRKNNDGPYSPENCEWRTAVDQANNRRSNVKITHNGETLTIAQWASKIGVKSATLWARINVSEWPIDKAISSPLKNK